MKHLNVKRLVVVSAVATLVSLAMMATSILYPKPLLLIMSMSVGQGIGTLSLAAYLLAIALDLQNGGAAADNLAETEEETRSDASHA